MPTHTLQRLKRSKVELANRIKDMRLDRHAKRSFKKLGKNLAVNAIRLASTATRAIPPLHWVAKPIADAGIQYVKTGKSHEIKHLFNDPKALVNRSLKQGGSDTLKLAQFGLDRIGVGLVAKPFTDSLRADLESNQKFGKFSNTKNIWNHPNKYFQKVGWNALGSTVGNYIPNADKIIQGAGSSLIHGNSKYAKNSLLNYPSGLYNSVVDI